MTKSAGLLRAYAVLQRVELLRQQDVFDPLPPDTDTDVSTSAVGTPQDSSDAISASSFLASCETGEGRTRLDSYANTKLIYGNRDVKCSSLCDAAWKSNLPCQDEHTSHHPGGSPFREDEEKLEGVNSHSYNPAKVGDMSPHSSLADGGNRALQSVLQKILTMRKQVSKNVGTKRRNDVTGIGMQSGDGTGNALQYSTSSLKQPLSRLLSTSQGDEGENIYFDELPTSYPYGNFGTQKREEYQRRSGRTGRRVHLDSKELSGDDDDGAVDDVHYANGEQKDALIKFSTTGSSHKKVRGSLTSSVMSDYKKSLYDQYRKHRKKTQDNFSLKKEHQSHMEPSDTDGHFMSSPEARPPVPIFSTISEIDDPDEGFSSILNRGLDFDASYKEVPRPPLMPFLCSLTTTGSAELQEELRNMEDCCDGTAARCRDWFALTALVNTPDAIRHIIVPLFLSELSKQGDMERRDTNDANSRLSNILCALIGLGDLAAGSLSTLLDMLTGSFGCPRLVALAIRAVGGNDGVHALCRVARSDKIDLNVRVAAVYGISVLSYPVLGHTNVYCVGGPKLSSTIVFYQPPVHIGYMEVEQSGDPRREPSLQRPPTYRPTHVILCAETVRRKLVQFTASRNFRRATSSYSTLSFLLQDFARDAPEACRHQGLPDDVLESLYHESLELEDVSNIPVRVLPFSYDPYFIGRKDELFAIEETLMVIIHDKQTPLNLVEQTLVSIASLPDFVTTHVALPVLDYIIQHVAHFEQCHSRESDQLESVLVAGLVALGRLVRNESTSPSVTDTACEVLLHNLVSPCGRVRYAACIGLGEVGVVTNKPREIARALAECLNGTAMNHDTVAWALTRLGVCGVRILLDHIAGDNSGGSDESNCGSSTAVGSISTRVTCARALARVDLLAVSFGIYEEARRLQDELVRRLSAIILSNHMEEDIALESAYALGEVIGVKLDGKVDARRHKEEAAAYYRKETPNEAFGVLRGLVESVDLPLSIRKALLYLLCLHGGAHGELCVSQTAIQSRVVALRASAVFGLRACGGKIIRTLVIALNDENPDVRVEAFDTLNAVGVDAVLEVLRSRPKQHTQQVIAALRDCLLRDVGRDVKRQTAQDLYEALMRS